MTSKPTESMEQGWEKTFDTLYHILLPDWEDGRWKGVKTRKEALKAFIHKVRQEAVEETKQLGKKIYVDHVDWSEWGMSDEKAGEEFEEHWKELSTPPKREK